MPGLLANFCFACCGREDGGARGGDQYLQPLNLLQPQANAVTGRAPGQEGSRRRVGGPPAAAAFAANLLCTAAWEPPCCAMRASLLLQAQATEHGCVVPAGRSAVEELVEQSAAARERVWRSLGSLEPFALGQSPGSSGVMAGPKWPAARQNFRVIHRQSGNIMIVSDGLR